MIHLRAALTLLLTLTFVMSPALTSPFSGFRADQLPVPQINPPVQPAGYAFAIWGLIYAWLVVSAVYGFWKRRNDPAWDAARLPLILSLAVGTPWLAVANASAIWATILIIVMAITAIWSLLRAPTKDIWLFRVPVGIYAGWLTAAAFVSLGSTAAGFDLVTDSEGWAYLGIFGALTAAVAVLRRRDAPEYGATMIWALLGIVVANGMTEWTVSALALAGIIALTAMIIAGRVTDRSALS